MTRILIIGASSGIGAAVAKAISSKGWKIILHGRDVNRLAEVGQSCSEPEGSGFVPTVRSKDDTEVVPTEEIEFVTGDVVAWAEDLKSIPSIEPVNAVIWSAGICDLAAGQMLSLKAVRRTLSVNLEAPLVVLSHFYRKGLIQSGGTIVLLGSQSAHHAGEGFSLYAASKGGLASAARVLDKEFSRKQIRVVCLEPGTVNTPMTQKLVAAFGGLKDGHEANMVEPEAVAEEILKILEGE